MDGVALTLSGWNLVTIGLVVFFAEVACGLVWRRTSHRRGVAAYLRGRAEAESSAPDQEKRWVQVTIPSFGTPVMKRYEPGAFVIPLVCPECQRALTARESYYEIPIMNMGGNVVTGVHVKCERKHQYG